ncbi:MAG: fucose isomerase [Clostridia bacterium]|nr:fucose isomerase [Clostridia bacterium]MBR3096192.1 fucose isomerase [Clostridia bacterium]
MSFQFAYVPIGVPTFHLESAQKAFDDSVSLLQKLDPSVKVPDEMLLSLPKLGAFLDTLSPDFVIVQNVTFANAAYMSEVLRRFSCPVLLWTLREPVIDGGRLRLNSLTGAYSAANVMRACGRRFAYVFGAPAEESVQRRIAAAVAAARLKKQLRSLNLLQIGHTPEGFGFGRGLDAELLSLFGVNLKSIEARELIGRAKTYGDDEIQSYLDNARARIVGLDKTPEKNKLDFARLYKAYDSYVKENGIGAVSSRCWPDFFVDFGTPVCAVLAMLGDNGVPASCEADAYGALSMYIGQRLTGKPTFFGDPVSLDEGENTVTFWHCGTAACSLAREDTGAVCDVHCNRRIGPTLDFGCKAAPAVTVFRIGREPDGSCRFFVCGGEALDKPKQFNGTSIVVKTEGSSRAVVERSVKNGWEPHFVVAMADIREELLALANMLDIPIEAY